MVAVAARDRSRAAVFAEKYAVERVLDGYQAVIDDAEVDVVYNALANSQHAPWNLAAIAAARYKTPRSERVRSGVSIWLAHKVCPRGDLNPHAR